MAKKIILSDAEYAVLYYYRELLTHGLKKNYRFPDTDDVSEGKFMNEGAIKEWKSYHLWTSKGE